MSKIHWTANGTAKDRAKVRQNYISSDEHATCFAGVDRTEPLGPYYIDVVYDGAQREARTYHEELIGTRKSPRERTTNEDIDVLRNLLNVVRRKLENDQSFDDWSRKTLNRLAENAVYRANSGGY